MILFIPFKQQQSVIPAVCQFWLPFFNIHALPHSKVKPFRFPGLVAEDKWQSRFFGTAQPGWQPVATGKCWSALPRYGADRRLRFGN